MTHSVISNHLGTQNLAHILSLMNFKTKVVWIKPT